MRHSREHSSDLTLEKLINHFGSVLKVAMAFDRHTVSVYQWGRSGVPLYIAYRARDMGIPVTFNESPRCDKCGALL